MLESRKHSSAQFMIISECPLLYVLACVFIESYLWASQEWVGLECLIAYLNRWEHDLPLTQ